MSDEVLTENSNLFYEKYLPLKNHLPGSQAEGPVNKGDKYAPGEVMGVDYYFETYGEEIAFVKEQPNEYIWTLIDADGGLYICQGMRHVNRLAYFVATVPWKEGEKSEYIDMLPDIDELEKDEIREWLEPWFREHLDEFDYMELGQLRYAKEHIMKMYGLEEDDPMPMAHDWDEKAFLEHMKEGVWVDSTDGPVFVHKDD